MLKLRKLQTNLDMWKARDLTLFGRVMIIKSLGLAKLIYSISKLNVPDEIIPNVKKRLSNFIWRNKRDKIKRESLYQDITAGGIRMVNFDVLIKALRLAWIPRLLSTETRNWKTIPDHFFKKCNGLNLLLRCNYDPKRLPQMPTFYKDILTFFNDLKSLYSGDGFQELILFNNKDILIDGKSFYYDEWLIAGILTIKDLLNENGAFLSFQEFSQKYSCRSNFLQLYQVTSVIPRHLLIKATGCEQAITDKLRMDNTFQFLLNDNIQLTLKKNKGKRFLLVGHQWQSPLSYWPIEMEQVSVSKWQRLANNF